MKRSKIFLATGALVLAVSAIFASKANKKYAFHVKTGISASNVKVIAPSDIWTISNTGTRAIVTLYTGSGKVLRTVLTTDIATSNRAPLYR